ncbi:MAG: 6-bladed beta-propeller [Prevotellaceae bacterium]|jgi:hypothetical protein|nr:6-bladed beta-propeller [Prevotellaceae bacterium]
MEKYLIIVLTAVLLSGCNHQKPSGQTGDYIRIPVNPAEASESVNMSEIFSDIEYIPLESVDKHLIGTVNQLIVYKDRFYIFDRYQTQSVFCFQQDGKFLFELNRKGQGPGEYIKLDNISIDCDNSHLLLYCGPMHPILVCDLDGNYIKSHRTKDIWAHEFSYTGNGYAAFYGGYTTNEKHEKNGMTPNLLIANTDNYNLQHTDLFFPSEIRMETVVGNFKRFSSYRNGTAVLLAEYDDTVYHISGEKVERAYYIDFGNMKKGKDFYSFLKSPATKLGQTTEYERTHDICIIRAVEETEKYMFFYYFHKFIGHAVFYNKRTGQVIDVCKDYGDKNVIFPIYNDINGGPLVFPLSSDGESFYGVVESWQILKEKESIQASNAAGRDKLLKMIDGINEFDNPVIVRMKLK